jgi:DNA-binding FadR family transcriptional regulator
MSDPTLGRSRRSASLRASAVLDYIVGNIENGTWKPGERLPTEREFEEQFGLARNTLRQTLRALQSKGLITRHVGRGTFVARSSSAPVDAAPDDLQRRIQGASPAEIMEVRLIVEPQAIELAAVRATADDLASITQCLHGCESAPDIATFEHWDGLLHERIVDAARNGLLSDIYQAINQVRRTAAWGKLKERSLTPQRRSSYEDHHRRIVEALRERDPERAVSAVKEHLIAVRASLLGA